MLFVKALVLIFFFNLVLSARPSEYISILLRKHSSNDTWHASPTTELLRTLVKERSINRTKSNYS